MTGPRHGRTRTIFPGHLGLAGALLFLVALTQGLAAAPYRPSDSAEVLERLPAGETNSETATLHEALARDPENLALALRLARAEYRHGRNTSDPRFLGYAEAALAPWLTRADPPAEALVMRALLRQRQHDFPGALGDLDRALAASPNHAQAWLTRAAILRVLGRHAEAEESCRRLPRRVPMPIAATCLSAVQSLRGEVETSARRLEDALAGSSDKGARVWAMTVLGDIAVQQGDPARAETAYRDGLSIDPDDGYLLAALADLLLAQGRAEAVLALLDGRTRNDALLLRLALAETAVNGPRETDYRRRLSTRFAAGQRRGESGHRREQARFSLDLLGEADAALALALENWRQQKEPADARLVLRTALAAGRPEAAEDVLTWLRESGLQDAQSESLAARLKGGEGS